MGCELGIQPQGAYAGTILVASAVRKEGLVCDAQDVLARCACVGCTGWVANAKCVLADARLRLKAKILKDSLVSHFFLNRIVRRQPPYFARKT
jgi:hypothetical protein